MTNIEIEEIMEYAAQRGYAIKRIEIKEDNSCHIKIKKIDAGSVGVWETEFGFSDIQTFKRIFSAKTKLIRKNGKNYIQKIRLKDSKSLREIKKYKKNNKLAKNMQGKYNDIFMLACEQIKDGFESRDDKCSDILECYSEHYLTEYNRILQNYWGVSRDANLMELKEAYMDVAKNVLYIYIVSLIRAYRENSDNGYKNRTFIPNIQLECARMLDRRYRIRYRRLRRSFMHMTVKSADYVTSFGASHKKVSEKNFFSDYISVAYPSNYEEMPYSQLKGVVQLCVNKNVESNSSKKKVFMALPLLGVGIEGKKTAQNEAVIRISERASVSFTGGSILKTVLPILTAAMILTSSTMVELKNPRDIAAKNPLSSKSEDGGNEALNFLPPGFSDLLETKIGLLANAVGNPRTMASSNHGSPTGGVGGMGGMNRNPGEGNTDNLPLGRGGLQPESQSIEGENAGAPGNNGMGDNSLPESISSGIQASEASPQQSSPKVSVAGINAPPENMPGDSEPMENNSTEKPPQENEENEPEPQENAPSEKPPNENAPNESEPKENAPSEKPPQENTPDITPQTQTVNEPMENEPVQNTQMENEPPENPAEAEQNESQAEINKPASDKENTGARSSPNNTSFVQDDFNVPVDFSSNKLYPDRPPGPITNKPPPGSLDRNRNPKKNPKTGQ